MQTQETGAVLVHREDVPIECITKLCNVINERKLDDVRFFRVTIPEELPTSMQEWFTLFEESEIKVYALSQKVLKKLEEISDVPDTLPSEYYFALISPSMMYQNPLVSFIALLDKHNLLCDVLQTVLFRLQHIAQHSHVESSFSVAMWPINNLVLQMSNGIQGNTLVARTVTIRSTEYADAKWLVAL